MTTLLFGAAGGNIAGQILKGKSLGILWNSVVGILGCGIGVFVLGFIDVGAGEAEWLWTVITSIIGGAVLL